LSSVLSEAFESVHVVAVRREMKHVSVRSWFDDLGAEQPSQSRNVDLEGLPSRSRRLLTPHGIDEPIRRNGSIGVEQEDGEDQALSVPS
jgi:hypothetical protein